MANKSELVNNLVSIYLDEKVQKDFTTNKKSHNIVWKSIVDRLGGDKIVTVDYCKNKIKALKSEFFKIARLPSGQAAQKFKFYDQFKCVYGKKPQATPEILVDSFDVAEIGYAEIQRMFGNTNSSVEDKEDANKDSTTDDQDGEIIEVEPLSKRKTTTAGQQQIDADDPTAEDNDIEVPKTEEKCRKRKSSGQQRDDKFLKYLKESDEKEDKRYQDNLELNKSLVSNMEKMTDVLTQYVMSKKKD